MPRTGRPWPDQTIEARAGAAHGGSGAAARTCSAPRSSSAPTTSSTSRRSPRAAWRRPDRHPYAVVSAGLAALEGPQHGGSSVRAEAMLAHAAGADAARGAGRAASPAANRSKASAIRSTRRRSPRQALSWPGCGRRGQSSPELAFVLTSPRRGRRARRTAERRLRAGRGRPRAAAPARRAADALRDRPHHRLDRPRHRAVRERPADSAAREVRRSGAAGLRGLGRRCGGEDTT